MTRPLRERPEAADASAPAPDLIPVRVRQRADDQRVATALWAVAALLVIAVLKPWGPGSAEPSLRPVVAAPTAVVITPEPTKDRTDDGLASATCLGAGTWQIASLETWRTQDVRVWRAIEPVASPEGPADPAIPAVPIVALKIAALGWCAPTFGPERPVGPATVTAWFVRGGVGSQLQLHQVQPADGVTPLAALYVPMTTCPEQTICAPLLPEPVPGPWVSGRVVFRHVDVSSQQSRWLAADIEIIGGGIEPTASPGAGA